MTRLAPPFRGVVTAAAFVVDVGLVGEEEGRRRVLAWWRPGATLRWADAGRWLLTLPEPVTVRGELAPGLPLPPSDVGPGVVRLLHGGVVVERDVTAMPYVDVGAWLRTSHLVRTPLTPVQPPPPPATRPAYPDPAAPVDLRAKAKVKEPSKKGRAAQEKLGKAAARARRRGLGRTRGSSGSSGAQATAPVRDLMARLALRTPVGHEIRRRHERYLRRLEERLRAGDYDALRDAVSMAPGGDFLSLRLPTRRSAVRPSTRLEGGGGFAPWGATVWEHLGDLYRATASRLEREGRLVEAAFVLADLLAAPREAVALLERHQRYAAAAELAEGRQLAPPVVVRLWWRAGRRDRALDVARARGAFPEAVRLAAEVDPALATELRSEWARTLAEAGDYAGAVAAAWPEVSLRPMTEGWLRTGMLSGGPLAARLLAYLVALHPTPQAMAASLGLATTRDPERRAARDAFVATLAEVPLSDAAADREVATAALRAVVRAEPPPRWADPTTRGVVAALRDRADPLLRADLPAWRPPPHEPVPPTAHAALPEARGGLPVSDVVPLPGGLLVAHGEHGTRLLDLTGRVRAHWDTPAHALVPSDTGTVVALATHLGGTAWELHRLDVADRRLRRCYPVAARLPVDGYDGDLLPVVGVDGTIEFLDLGAQWPKALWRELGEGAQAVAVARSPKSMAAVVHHAGTPIRAPYTEVWRWDLPSRTLRQRREVTFQGRQERWVLTSTGHVGTVRPSLDGESAEIVWDGRTADSGLDPRADLVASGAAAGVIRAAGTALDVDVMAHAPGPVDVTLRFPEEVPVDLRLHGGLAAVWDSTGRIAVASPADRRIVAALRTPS